MRIGILQGSETAFAQALADRLKEAEELSVVPLRFGGADANEPWDCDLVVDRASRDLPALGSWLRAAALDGVEIIGDPFRRLMSDRFFEHAALHRMGISVPPMVLLPNKDTQRALGDEAYGDLAYPLDWEALLNRVGRPAWFKPVRHDAREDVHKIHTVDELLYRFDRAGTSTAMLQADVIWERYYRVFVFGGERTVVAGVDGASGLLSDPVRELNREDRQAMAELARRVSRALGHEFNAVEIARDGDRLTVVDGANPDPRIEASSMDEGLFARLVEGMARTLRRRAADLREGRGTSRLAALLGPPPASEAPRRSKGQRGRGRRDRTASGRDNAPRRGNGGRT